MMRAGAIGVDLPHRLVQVLLALNTYGPFGAAPHIAAIRHGAYPAIADERGELTYTEFDEAVNRIANAFRARLAPGDTVGILVIFIKRVYRTESGYQLERGFFAYPGDARAIVRTVTLQAF